MRLVVDLILGAILGFLGHQIRPALQRDFEEGWFSISCYVLGVLLGLPLVITIHEDLDGMEDGQRMVAAYLLAFLGLGTGVVAGWYLDSGERAPR